MNCYADHAEEYLEAGWFPIPLPAGEKYPPPVGYTGRDSITVTPLQVADWSHDHPDGNIGLALPEGVIAIDVDHYDSKAGENSLTRLEQLLGPLPATYRSTARSGNQGHYFFRVPAGKQFKPGAGGSGLDIIQHTHRYSIGWPSLNPKTGTTYKWYGPDGVELLMRIPDVELLPDLPESWVEHLERAGDVGERSDVSTEAAKEWLGRLDTSEACQFSTNLASSYRQKILSGDSRHDAALMGTRALVAAGAEGHSGIPELLNELKKSFLKATASDGGRDSDHEWDKMLLGAVGFVVNQDIRQGCPCSDNIDIRLSDDWGEPVTDKNSRIQVDVTDPDAASEWFTRELGRGNLSDLFDRGGKLVHVGERVTEITADILLALTRSGYYGLRTKTRYAPDGERFDTQSTQIITKDHVHAAFHGSGRITPHLRKLEGIIETPVVRPDGTPLSLKGYDPTTRLLLSKDSRVTEPTDLESAKEIILEPLKSIPWVSGHHKANYLGALFTPLLRLILPPPWPLVLIEAPTSGTGKSMLAQILRILHGGVTEGPLPHDKDELAKSVSATLATTTGSVVIRDNQVGRIASPYLDMLLTSATISARTLGKTSTHHLINDRLWVVTMNGASVGGDLHRRTLPVALDAKMRNPERRHFDYLADEYVKNHRGEILGALLHIVEEWVKGGSPTGSSQIDQYSKWRAGISGLLSWSGLAGDFDSSEVREEIIDPDREEFDGVLQALARLYPRGAEFTANQVVARIVQDRPLEGVEKPMAVSDLPEYLAVEFSRGYGLDLGIISKKFGYWLRNHNGQVGFGEGKGQLLTLQRLGRRTAGTTWRVLPNDVM